MWLVMERRITARVLRSPGHSFVNNHFWNCYEEPAGGAVVVEAVAATSDYLDNYFERNLRLPTVDWSRLFSPPISCRVPTTSIPASTDDDEAAAGIECEPMLGHGGDASADRIRLPDVQPALQDAAVPLLLRDRTERRVGTLVRHARQGGPLQRDRWRRRGQVVFPGVYLTEADLCRALAAEEAASRRHRDAEDDGLLLTVLYNASADASLAGVFDARTVTPLGLYPLGRLVVPFHAHGIVCLPGEACFTNP